MAPSHNINAKQKNVGLHKCMSAWKMREDLILSPRPNDAETTGA